MKISELYENEVNSHRIKEALVEVDNTILSEGFIDSVKRGVERIKPFFQRNNIKKFKTKAYQRSDGHSILIVSIGNDYEVTLISGSIVQNRFTTSDIDEVTEIVEYAENNGYTKVRNKRQWGDFTRTLIQGIGIAAIVGPVLYFTGPVLLVVSEWALGAAMSTGGALASQLSAVGGAGAAGVSSVGSNIIGSTAGQLVIGAVTSSAGWKIFQLANKIPTPDQA